MSEYLDYRKCKCRKKVAYLLVEECDKNTDKNEIIHSQKNNYKNHKRTIKQVNIKNRQNYSFNDMTNISDFDVSLLNIDQIAFKSNDSIIYSIVNDSIKNLNSSNSLYHVFNGSDAYIEKSGENKYLIFASTNKNEMVFGDYTEVWDEIKEQIELISGNKVIKYSKDESDEDFPLGKILNIPVYVIVVKGVFEEDSKYYPQVLLHQCFYEYEENIENLLLCELIFLIINPAVV